VPPKYILGYYYIHNPLLVTLCAKKVDHPTPPHPTTEVSDESTRMPKGRRKNENWFTFQKFPEPTVPETTTP